MAYKINWDQLTKQLGVQRTQVEGITKVLFCKGEEIFLALEEPKVYEYKAKGEVNYQVSGKKVVEWFGKNSI